MARGVGRSFMILAVCSVVAVGIRSSPVSADEGMWTFDNLPMSLLHDRYGFTPPVDWLDNLRLASVRFNGIGSGSFISPTGLVLTNHHVALDQIEKLSTGARNYAENGFYARHLADEARTTGLELNVLVSLEDVTERIAGEVAAAKGDAARSLEARHRAMAAIASASQQATGLQSEIVTLYQGGEYWLYRYKRFTDVRLVFAPERQIAFFGGDADNFTYPRHDLDFAIFRVYENGRPFASSHYLRWNVHGAAAGDLVFVSGHPGATNRQETVAELETERDLVYPTSLSVISRRLETLRTFAQRSSESARRAESLIFELENAYKAFNGELRGLQDPMLMDKKRADEAQLRQAVRARSDLGPAVEAAWEAIAHAEQLRRPLYAASRFRLLRGSSLAASALTLIQDITERQKPDVERRDGFHEAQLPSLEGGVLAATTFYPDLEEVLLGDALQESLHRLGPEDPFVRAVLGTHTPAEVAHHAIHDTRLADVAVRRALLNGGAQTLGASTDPLVALARTAAPFVADALAQANALVASLETPAHEQLGRARFAVFGTTSYPDATSTLRLSFGTVRGYAMNGTKAPPQTTFYGLFDRAYSFDFQGPFALPQRYRARRASIELGTPLDFVSTTDIIGGNSGSPVVDRDGRLVGLIFDGNMESLVGRFVYSDQANRAIAVHAAAIIETLRRVYGAGALAREILEQHQ